MEENPNRPTDTAAADATAEAGESVKESASPAQTQASPTMPAIPAAPVKPAQGAQTPTERTPAREVPAGTKPAATKAPGAAVKGGATPTATVAKGIPKAAARPATSVVAESAPDPPVNKLRRLIIWSSIAGSLAVYFMMFVRFFLPRAIFEPSTVFRIGFPSDYGLGVDTKWQQQHRIWVDKTSDRLFVIYARCTHLGCTPDWKLSENKFKCPCHGSGYDSEGINFEGPAPRPMDRAHVQLDAEGQIVVDTNRLYQKPKGEVGQFDEPGSYIPL